MQYNPDWTKLLVSPLHMWVFYAKQPGDARPDWVSNLTMGGINFWWHGRGDYGGRGGAPYSKSLMQGDGVVMVVGDEIVAIGELAGGADWKFVDELGRRRWPVLITVMLPKPILRTSIESGERIIPYSGTVCPLPARPHERLNDLLDEILSDIRDAKALSAEDAEA